MGTKKRYEYFPNDQITFRVSGEDFYRKDYILALSDTSLIFANGVVTISEIERVKLPVTSWMAVTGGTLVVAGVGIISLTLLMRSLSVETSIPMIVAYCVPQ